MYSFMSLVAVLSMDMIENTAQNSSMAEIINKIFKKQVYALHLKKLIQTK